MPLNSGAKYSDMQYPWRIAKKTLSRVARDVCNDMCEEYVDEVMTAPPQLKNGNNWQIVSTRIGTFLNCVAIIDDKHIRKRAISGSLYYKYNVFSASSDWLLLTQTTSSCEVTLVYYLASGNAPMRTYLTGSFGRMRKVALRFACLRS